MPPRKELPPPTFFGAVGMPLLKNERIRAPLANRLSDAAFVGVLSVTGLALALIPLPAWLRMIGFDVLLAVASGVILYLVLKYAAGAHYPTPGAGMQPGARVPLRDNLALGYILLALAWAGLVITVAGDMTVGIVGGLAGATVSGAAGLLLLFDFRGATSGIARHDVAVNFILKPAWLQASRISLHERMALGRATGMAWLVGAVVDLVTTVTR
jgi:hypothetical protein